MQALGEVVCRTELRERPLPPPPARTYALLRPGAPDAVRTVALLAAWLGSGAGQVLGALDRRNALRSQDDLAVRGPCLAGGFAGLRSRRRVGRLCCARQCAGRRDQWLWLGGHAVHAAACADWAQ